MVNMVEETKESGRVKGVRERKRERESGRKWKRDKGVHTIIDHVSGEVHVEPVSRGGDGSSHEQPGAIRRHCCSKGLEK